MATLLPLAGLVLALGTGGWLRWSSPAEVADLRPRGDALEYEETARSLARGDGYVLVIAGEAFPPIHPFGFPALMAPYLWAADGGFGSGIRVVWAAALVAILATFGLGSTLGPMVAVVAALLLALNALHVSWSRAVMSDVPGSAAVALLAWWTVRLLHGRAGSWAWFGLGVAAGLAASIRPPSLLLLLPAGALLVLVPSEDNRTGRLAALAAGTALGLVPLLAYNTLRFGSPLTDGVAVWFPGDRLGARIMVAERGSDRLPNWIFYPRLLAGLGALYPWPIAVLAAGGAALGLVRGGPARTIAVLGLGFTAALLAFHVGLAWQWSRYFLLSLPLLVVMAALPSGADSPPGVRGVALALAVAAVWMSLRVPARYAPPAPSRREVDTLCALDERVEGDAIVIAHANTIVFERIMRRRAEADRVLAPIGVDEFQLPIALAGVPRLRVTGAPRGWLRPSLPQPGVPAAVERQVRKLLAEGRPVYCVPTLGAKVRAVSATQRLIARRFHLRPMGAAGPGSFQRVELPVDEGPAR